LPTNYDEADLLKMYEGKSENLAAYLPRYDDGRHCGRGFVRFGSVSETLSVLEQFEKQQEVEGNIFFWHWLGKRGGLYLGKRLQRSLTK